MKKKNLLPVVERREVKVEKVERVERVRGEQVYNIQLHGKILKITPHQSLVDLILDYYYLLFLVL